MKGGILGLQMVDLVVCTDVDDIFCQKKDYQLKGIKGINFLFTLEILIQAHRNCRGKRKPMESTFIESLLWVRYADGHTTYYLI